jgi:tripeptidyl-peptidase-1
MEASTAGRFNTFLDALDGSYCTYTAYGITGDTPGVDPTYPDPAPGGYKGPLQCGTYKPTRVISVSYAGSEYDAPANYTRRQCNEFLKLGLQGHTFVWATGDFGVASFPDEKNDNGCLGDDATIYNPSFPTCPYVTNVGAARLYDNQTVLDRESAMQANLGVGAELFASGGGFANYFPVPSYQKSAVAHYFKHHDPGLPSYIANADATNIGAGGGLYNKVGRGFPDVSANGAEFRAYNNQTLYHFYGTSLAAPIWGSIMTLINEERTAVGKGPVGFINPSLYANTWVFNDIVNGSNPGCGSKGFSAVEGWDPVTGLGTPNYPSLLKLFLSLP